MLRTIIISCCILLTACAEGPSDSYTLAQQGLLSGAVSKDGSKAIIGSIHHGGSLWDIQKNVRLYSWNHIPEGFSSFRQVQLSEDGKVAVTTEESAIGVWNAQTGESLNFWQAKDRILSVALNENGSKALIGMRDGTVDYFDLRSGQVLQRMSHKAEVRSVALSDARGVGISGSDDFSAIIWNLKTGEPTQTLTLSNQIKTVALSESGQQAFVSAQREGVTLLDVETGKTKGQLDSRYTNYTSVAFIQKDSQILAGTSAGTIELWSVRDLSRIRQWETKPKKLFGRTSSKAVLGVGMKGKTVKALTSDGTVQTFQL